MSIPQSHKPQGKLLEDYEPGANKAQVVDALRKVAGAKKKPKKSASPPETASS